MHSIPLWPLLLYAMVVVFLLAAILSLSYFLGQHHSDRATGKPYEGGIEQTGSARLKFSAQFYLVAMLFVIFDVEAVFIMLWACQQTLHGGEHNTFAHHFFHAAGA